MSRVIVKGLPKGLKEERLQTLFKEIGTVTDCSLKYTQEGVFRKFAFVGFSSEKEAKASIKHFNRSFIDTSRITVELAKDFGDSSKPRAWSKYSRDSSAYQKMVAKLEEKQGQKEKDNEEKAQKQKTNKVDQMLGELKDDAKFHEFIEAHKNKSTKATWSNDTGVTLGGNVAPASSGKEGVAFDESEDDEGVGDSDEEEVIETKPVPEEIPEETADKVAKKSEVSDLDYLKSKMSKSTHLEESSDSDSEESDSEESDTDTKPKKKSKKKKEKSAKSGKTKKNEPSDESESEDGEESSDEEEDTEKEKIAESTDKGPVRHVIKMKGLPPTVREKQIKDFFLPLVVVKVRIPKNAKGRNTNSVATVEFSTEKDTDQGMRKNKNFIGPKRIFLYKVKKEITDSRPEKSRPWEQKKEGKSDDEEEETIAESGRLYVRNLSYLCKEDDIEAHFGTYGPLSEVHLPIDSITRKVKGFAFITYMMPEHAVRAYTELDGTVFQGRMLHILPGKAKKEEDLEITDSMSFKKKKEIKQKQQASSSHNWNALFLGTSAVADVMAERYGATKSQILDADSRQSLGVRMALGETQLVAETKQFLIDNGVSLDAFGQATCTRSKTVILAKNLPAGTTVEDLRQLFARYGVIGRLVLPPSGITGIIEFAEPTEARTAFRSLAYTKFQHLPLYLEWAPVDALKGADKPTQTQEEPSTSDAAATGGAESGPQEEKMDTQDTKEESESSSESEDEAEPESTIYVKNLNFETTDESLKAHFASCGDVRQVTVAKKKDMKNPGSTLSMGFGFVEFKARASAQQAMKTLQHSQLDEHQLELKVSNKRLSEPAVKKKKQDTKKKQTSTKILVRNIPFEAKAKEIRQLFSTFGELKTVRLPKKLGGTGTHRGFCFVDFLTKQDAKRAFKALCVSTRLYGRRLVLEWADADESVEQLRKKTAEHFHDEAPSKRLKKSALMEELKLSAD